MLVLLKRNNYWEDFYVWLSVHSSQFLKGEMFNPKDKRWKPILFLLLIFLLFFSKLPSSEPSSPTAQSVPAEHTPLTRVSSASRSYDLTERRRTGNMTGAEQAKYQRIPTDESEAQTLASADLDGIKSECESFGKQILIVA